MLTTDTPRRHDSSDFPFSAPEVPLESLMAKLREVGLADNRLVLDALEQAQRSHATQRRDGGGPYLEQHIYPVTLVGIEYEQSVGHRVSAKFVAMLLTHDVPEDDASIRLPDFRELFGRSSTHELKPGRSVADLVTPLTKGDPDGYPGATEAERKEARDLAYHEGLRAAQYDTQIGKLVDRLINVQGLHLCLRDKILRKIEETEEHYLPIAARVAPKLHEAIKERLDSLRLWIGGAA